MQEALRDFPVIKIAEGSTKLLYNGGKIQEKYFTKQPKALQEDEIAAVYDFENHLVGVMIDRFGQDIMVMAKDNEYSVTRVQVNVSTQFYGWLAALGSSVRLLSPENVRKEYRDFLKKALENYEG